MANVLDQENTLHTIDGTGYDLNVLANISPEQPQKLSAKDLEQIIEWIQGQAVSIKHEIQFLTGEIERLADKKKKKSAFKDFAVEIFENIIRSFSGKETRALTERHEHEIREAFEANNDLEAIQEFMRQNNIHEHTDINHIIKLIKSDAKIKKIIISHINDSLTPQQKGVFSSWIQEKTPSQIQKIFQKESYQELGKFVGRKGDAILVGGGSLLIMTGIVLWFSVANPFKGKEEHKQRANKEVVDTSKSLIQVPDKIIPTLEKIDSVQQLQSWIPDSAIDKGITLDQVMSGINAIADKNVRIQVIKDIKLGDIASAQEIFGMKKQTKYKSNRASGTIDAITLERFEDPLFNLSGDELIGNAEIPQDVKNVYQKFLIGEYENDGLCYGIVSKSDATLYLFTKYHTLLNHQTVLLGSKKGDAEFILHISPTTPAGFYRVQQNTREDDGSGIVYVPGYMKNGKYISEDAQGYLLDLLPIDIVTGKYNHAYDINKGTLSIHPTPSHLQSGRKSKIESANLVQKRETGGCVNASQRGVLYDNMSAGGVEEGSIIVITQDH